MKWIIAVVAVFLLWVLIAWRNRRRVKFTYDDINPYRRWCESCGQQQEVIWEYDEKYWEAMGRIAHPSCPCHTRQD